VLKKAGVPVLVVRRTTAATHRIIVAVDGTPSAEQAIAFLCRLQPKRRWTAILVNAVMPLYTPRHGMLSSDLVKRVKADVAEHNARRRAEAAKVLVDATQRLRESDWRVRPQLASGDALQCILRLASEHHADLLVVGAGRAAATKGKLGLVTQGSLAQCRVPVLVVR
jgi:nucleotide-binding universal stress UspA family protein